MQMEPESYDVLISSSRQNAALVSATAAALSSRGFDVWSAVTEKRTRKAAERLQKAIESTEAFLFVITPQAHFSSQMYFELGATMGRALSGQPPRVIFVLVDTSGWQLIPRFLHDFEVIRVDSGTPQETAARLAESLVGAGSSAA